MQKVLLIAIFASYVIGFNDNWGKNNQLNLMQDMSEYCNNNLKLDVFLPYGKGVADAVVILLSSKDDFLNCSITFSRHKTEILNIIFVIEFSNTEEHMYEPCLNSKSTKLTLNDSSDSNVMDICKSNQQDSSVFLLVANSPSITFSIQSKSFITTFKLTATAAKKTENYSACLKNEEISCMLDNSTYCIDGELLCDKNINCGIYDKNDEDIRVCEQHRYDNLWVVVISCIIMLIIITAFLIHLCKMFIPTVPDNFFIFNEDEDNKLILVSKFAAAQRSLEHGMHHPELSYYKFNDFPLDTDLPSTSTEQVEEIGSFGKSATMIQKGSSTRLHSIDNIEQLRAEIRKEIEDEISKAILDRYPVRFNSTTFITMMDHIDPPASIPNPSLHYENSLLDQHQGES